VKRDAVGIDKVIVNGTVLLENGELTGALLPGPARPCALLTLSELCFTVREVFFSFGPHTHHEPVGRRVATIDLRIARVRS